MTKSELRKYANNNDMTLSEARAQVREKRQKEEILKPNLMFQEIYNAHPAMIHENKYIPIDCILCGASMPTIHDTHNPAPLTPECFAKQAFETRSPNRCCSKCNSEKVAPARLSQQRRSVA